MTSTFSHNDGTRAVALHFSKWYRSDTTGVDVFTEEGAPVARVVSVPYISVERRNPIATALLPQVSARIAIEQGAML
jgi:hypothetical protein